MRIAYLVLAHRNPDQLRRLVDRLDPDAPVFVHFDQRAPRRTFARAQRLLQACSNVRFVPRHPCYWGSFGIVSATLECIRAATLATPDLDDLACSEKLFARKFDTAVDAAVLDLIDARARRAAGA